MGPGGRKRRGGGGGGENKGEVVGPGGYWGERDRERETGCRVRPNDPCWCQFILALSEITEVVILLDLDPD